MQRGGGGGGRADPSRVADLSAQIDGIAEGRNVHTTLAGYQPTLEEAGVTLHSVWRINAAPHRIPEIFDDYACVVSSALCCFVTCDALIHSGDAVACESRCGAAS